MNLSIVTVNWNTKDCLERCLDSIRTNPLSGTLEVIVVDNASRDGSAKMVLGRFSEVILIENKENVGYAKGNNQAIQIAQGEYILLLNPDTEIKHGALDALVKFARSKPDAAAVGCRLINPDGNVERSCRNFPSPMSVLFEYVGLSRLFSKSRLLGAYRMTYFDYSHDAELDQPMASCLLVSKSALDDVGMFDEDFPIFFNDVDWCYRAKQKGWKIYFTPDAEVFHLHGASTRQAGREMIKESHRGLLKFYEKHYRHKLWPPVYWFIVGAIKINGAISSRLRPVSK